MGNKRDWHHTRSTHADVLESLERVIRAHPSGSAGRPPAMAADTMGTVVDLRSRLVVARSGAPEWAASFGSGPQFDGDDAA